jgi:hypothetical protein
MLQADTPPAALRPRRAPDTYALAGIEVLGLGSLKPRARFSQKRAFRYHWFAGRNPSLRAVGLVAEEHGMLLARMAADAVLARVDEGLAPTSREAAWIVREAAHRLNCIGGRPS